MVIFPTANITEIFYIKLKDVDNQLIWLYDKEDALNYFHKAVNDVFNIFITAYNNEKTKEFDKFGLINAIAVINKTVV